MDADEILKIEPALELAERFLHDAALQSQGFAAETHRWTVTPRVPPR